MAMTTNNEYLVYFMNSYDCIKKYFACQKCDTKRVSPLNTEFITNSTFSSSRQIFHTYELNKIKIFLIAANIYLIIWQLHGPALKAAD